LPLVLHDPLYKTLFFDFGFRPPNAQNLLSKICTKSTISQLVWQIDWRCLGLLGNFRRWPIQWNHAKCSGADPCCHGNEIWARRGDPVAYRLVKILVSCTYCCINHCSFNFTISHAHATTLTIIITLWFNNHYHTVVKHD